jgi:hypothetical protein
MIPQGIPAAHTDVPFKVHPKGQKKIKQHRRSKCKTGNVNKILSDGKSWNTHFFTDPGAYSQNLPFNEVSELIHSIKIINPII